MLFLHLFYLRYQLHRIRKTDDMYTLIKQVTIKGTSTADMIAKNDSVITLHRQMVATYNTDITKYNNYMHLQIDEQMVMGYVLNHGNTAIIYYIIDEDNKIVSRKDLL